MAGNPRMVVRVVEIPGFHMTVVKKFSPLTMMDGTPKTANTARTIKGKERTASQQCGDEGVDPVCRPPPAASSFHPRLTLVYGPICAICA